MNGETKNKLKGGVIGASCMLVLAFGSFTFGYGTLNNRVANVEKEMNHIEDIRERLVRVETILERIDGRLLQIFRQNRP